MSASEAARFTTLHRAAAGTGMRLTYDHKQGCYWLAYGIHCTPLPDLKAVNRALVTGCGLHTLYPDTLRLVTVELPEPEPVAPVVQEAAPQWVKALVTEAKSAPEQPPQSIAEIKREMDQRRAQAVSSDDWWRKDRTPQNMKKRVTP